MNVEDVNQTEVVERIPAISADILNALPDMTFLVTPEGRVLECNTVACSTLGKACDDIVHRQFETLLRIPFHQQFQFSLYQCLKTGKIHEYEAEMIHGGGATVDVLMHLAPYPAHDKPGSFVCFIVARDISQDRKMGMDLLRFANVAHYTVNPVEITDANGMIIYVNPAFEKASGYAKEELLGKNPNIFGSGKHSKSFWQKVWTTITSGKVWVGDIENRKRTGEAFFTHLLISPIQNDHGEIVGYFGVHRDVTEQRFLEQKLVQAQKMESIGLLAAGIAHEVGNPLTSISSLVQVIQRTTHDEFAKEKLELIKSQVARISRIIRDLVDFSRRSNYTIQLTDINKSVQEAIEIVRVGKKAKSVTFETALEPSLPALQLVPDQIQQVFINILINAVDALFADTTPGDRPKKISVATNLKNDNAVITISDTGKGIAEDDIPKVFEPFFTTKKVGEGTGLGLWVSYGIVKSFNGDIYVESRKNHGTTFTINLPLNARVEA